MSPLRAIVVMARSLGHRIDAVMSDAFAALGGTDADLVSGPVVDGGHYLVGATEPPGLATASTELLPATRPVIERLAVHIGSVRRQ